MGQESSEGAKPTPEGGKDGANKKQQINVRIPPWALLRLRQLRAWEQENMKKSSSGDLLFKREKYYEAWLSSDATLAGQLLTNEITKRYFEELRQREIEAIVIDIESGLSQDECLEKSRMRGLIEFGSGKIDSDGDFDDDIELDHELIWWLNKAWHRAVSFAKERQQSRGEKIPLVVQIQELQRENTRLKIKNAELKRVWNAIKELSDEHRELSAYTEKELQRIQREKADIEGDEDYWR